MPGAPATSPAAAEAAPSADELRAELSAFAETCLARGRELGIEGVEVVLTDSRSVEVCCRRQKLESIDFRSEFNASIRVTHNQRRANANVNERSEKALLCGLENALDISRFTEPDPLYGLPDPEQMCKPEDLEDLGLFHPHTVDTARLEELTLECEQAGFDHDSRISNSEGSHLSCTQSIGVSTNSYGNILDLASSNHDLGVCLLAQDGSSSESDYYFSRSRSFDGLLPAPGVGAECARRAVARLHPVKPQTIACPVIFSAEVAGDFLAHLLEANDGSAIKRGESFLIGKRGKPVAARLLSMRERPRIVGGYASRCFDNEGVRCRDNTFVEEGSLASHSLDSYHARHLGLATTGNGGGYSNIEVECSERSEAELMAEAGRGLLVTDLIGFGVNLTTGDYSRGAVGFWFENGQIQHPANECTVAARLQEAYHAIEAIAGNRWPHHNISVGSVLVGKMMVGGVG